MRLLIASLTLALGLCVGQVHAGSAVLEEETYHWGKKLYCSGDSILSNAMMTKVDLDTGYLKSVEYSGVVCKLLGARQVQFHESFAFNYGGVYKVIFHEFFDDQKVAWYRWEYKNK